MVRRLIAAFAVVFLLLQGVPPAPAKHIYAENARETTITTGTGNLTLLGAVPGYQAFSDAPNVANGDSFPCTIQNRDVPTEKEIDICVWLTGNIIQRAIVLESTNADALVNFSPGTKDIWSGPTAWDAKRIGLQSGSVADQTIASATSALLTGSAIQIPNTGMVVGGQYRAWFTMSKTAAGTTSVNTFFVRVGTTGTVSDTARLTFTMPAGTAAVDNALVDVLVTVRGPLSASGRIQGNIMLNHNLQTTGFAITPNVVQNVLSGTFDLTGGIPGQVISLSCTTGTSWVLTFQQVSAELFPG